MPQEAQQTRSSVELIAQAAAGRAPDIARMPRPSLRRMVEMRDGARLDTFVWLPPTSDGPWPAILIRTPYQEHVLGWARLGTQRYREAGYAVVFQLVRGIGASEGSYVFYNPLNRPDGHDAVEWVAAQPWCDGQVGMDGSSYAGITQLFAASARPPHLRCIVPAVISAHPFLHIPRLGGAFSRQHTLGWTQIIQVESLGDLAPGYWGAAALLASPQAWRNLLRRPAIDAADGLLFDDKLAHYRSALEAGTMESFGPDRALTQADCAQVNVPCLLVTGLFDSTVGTLQAWRMLEAYGPPDAERRLLIGPWDHGQAYVGGERRFGPHDFGPAADFDLAGARLAFFDRHLRGRGDGPELPGRVSVFVSGANRWIGADAYPLPQTRRRDLALTSDGLANLRGRGRLIEEPVRESPPDRFEHDPELPFVPVAANLDPDLALDLREIERQEDTLVYEGDVLAAPLTLIGEVGVDLTVAVDAPDADFVCWLAEATADGRSTILSRGLLRLRYREGFDAERFLTPDEPVHVSIPMTDVAHRSAAGSRLRLVVTGGDFPQIDPNPHLAEPVANAVGVRRAVQTVFHEPARPSRVRLPVVEC